MAKRPEVGDPAPDVNLPTDGAGEFRLSRLRGTKVVLYFYPKDDTPGCTREAVAFTGALEEFEKAGAVVVGISRDTCGAHAKFRDKFLLEHTLAADEDGKVCDAYGVWVEKNRFGRKSMGIQRATFLIDGDGVIRKAWPQVSVEGHICDVLAAVRALP